ncbi:MAG: hypothetical protein J0I32_24275 [Sphingobacteriales bacterium]|nr:hypothetical protein [Sphingobacteriales bacterium]
MPDFTILSVSFSDFSIPDVCIDEIAQRLLFIFIDLLEYLQLLQCFFIESVMLL